MVFAATALSFSFSERLNALGILGILFLFVLQIRSVDIQKSWKDFFISGSLLFFIIQLAGVHWPPSPEAFQSVEVKLSFLILPLLFSTLGRFLTKDIQRILFLFSIALCISFLYSFTAGCIKYHEQGMTKMMNRMSISEAIMHPGYYSNFFCLALVWNVNTAFNMFRAERKLQWVHIGLALFFLMVLFLLLSKTALLFLVLFMVVLFRNVVALFLSGWKQWLFLSGIVLLTAALMMQIPGIRYRIQETKGNTKEVNKETTKMNSTGSRIIAWDISWKLIKRQPLLGYGSGQANRVLLQEMEAEGYHNLVRDRMQTHNQWLHTWLETGIAGVLVLLLLLVFLFIRFIRWQEDTGIWMVPLWILNMLTDDALEIQAVLVFILFFTCLFYYRQRKHQPVNL